MSDGSSAGGASGPGTATATTAAGGGAGTGPEMAPSYPSEHDGYEPDDELDEDDVDEDDESDEPEEDEDDELEEDDVEDVVDEVVLGLLDRVDRAEELTRADVRDLAWLLGPRPAGRLAHALNGEAAQRRRGMPRRGFLATLFAAPHEAPDPLPDSIAALLLRIESGQRIGWADLRRLVRVIGEPATVILQQAIAQAATSDPGRARHRSRRGGRRGR